MTGGNTLYSHGLPPLLRAATPTTPTQSYSQTLELEHRNEDKTSAPTPMQTLVSHIQHVQAATSSGSAVQLAGTPTATAQALPLTAITLPAAAPGTGREMATPLHSTCIYTPEGEGLKDVPPCRTCNSIPYFSVCTKRVKTSVPIVPL